MLRSLFGLILLWFGAYYGILAQAKLKPFDVEKRRGFTRSYLSLEGIFFSGGYTTVVDGQTGLLESRSLAWGLAPSLSLGRRYFGGHIDFFATVALPSLGPRSLARIDLGVLTGGRYYPWALASGRLRPYVSYGLGAWGIRQGLHGEERLASFLGLGLAYERGVWSWRGGYDYGFFGGSDLYLSPSLRGARVLPSHFWSLGMAYGFEFRQAGHASTVAMLDAILGLQSRAGWFVGAGPSWAFMTGASPYLRRFYPYLDGGAMPRVFVDWALGHHWSKQDWVLALAYRSIGLRREAFDVGQAMERRGLSLEVYKFLGDYHGFAPFVGGAFLADQLNLREWQGSGLILSERRYAWTGGLVAGWDIRPKRRGDIWVLRTNLRYAPFLTWRGLGGEVLSWRQLEFNVIQWVVYPQRWRLYKKLDRLRHTLPKEGELGL